MTDVHCHVSCGDLTVRELLIGRDFVGVHPWGAGEQGSGSRKQILQTLREQLTTDSRIGVGEIGLDRLRNRTISPSMREMFERQLELANEFHRPVVLHGAKCWGQVVETIRRLVSRPSQFVPAFLFHGFSRSDGLIPDIVTLNGYISVGPAVLNDHAVNYRELVKKIPLDRLLLETDRTEENVAECPSVRDVLEKTSELRGVSAKELERITDANAEAFFPSQSPGGHLL